MKFLPRHLSARHLAILGMLVATLLLLLVGGLQWKSGQDYRNSLERASRARTVTLDLESLLACMLELIPWLKQWHNEPDANFGGLRLGDHFEDFVTEEARQLGKTVPEIKAWQPPKKTGKGTKKASKGGSSA